MLSTAISMFICVALFATYLKPQTRRRIVGYGLIVDITVWVLLLGVFSGTGGERLGSIGASIGITAAIHFYRFCWGYERREQGRWVRYAGRFT